MTGHTEVLKRVLRELRDAGVDYMLVGSVAASAHGMIRDTHDVDIVVVLDKPSVRTLAERMGEDFYFDPEAAEEAVERGDMFNIMHHESFVKVDFWPLGQDEFSQVQFSRRKADKVWGIEAFVESAEDTVLSKLLWNKITPSERQVSDATGILLAAESNLDYDYLRSWASKLGVAEILNRLIEETKCQEDHS